MSDNSIGPLPREVLHRGRKFDFERLTIPSAGPNQAPIFREIIRHPGAVVILPLLHSPEGPQVLLIRSFRPALERWILELPAGTREPAEPEHLTAARELAEETGYEAATIEPLARFYTSPGLSDELMHAFIARGLRHVGQRLEADERIVVHPVPVAEALRLVDEGHIVDAKSMLTLFLALRTGALDSP